MRMKLLVSAASAILLSMAIAPLEAYALNMYDRTCRLASTDEPGNGRYYDVHFFAAVSGNSVTMSIVTDGFDPVMLIRDPDAQVEEQSRDNLYRDFSDNVIRSNRSDNASMTNLKSGIYAIVVTSENPGELGDYRLRVNSIDAISQPFRLPADCTGY